MSSLIPSGGASGTGSVTLLAPNTNSNQTQTLPDATGTIMVSGNMPAFFAYLSAGQSIGAAGFTKLNLDTEKFDTNSNFASGKFTPTVAGYYQITGSIAFGTTASLVITSLYKNGARDAMNETIFGGSLTGGSTLSCTTIIYMNGTTDYIELYAYSNSTGNSIQGGSGTPTYLTGCLLRTA